MAPMVVCLLAVLGVVPAGGRFGRMSILNGKRGTVVVVVVVAGAPPAGAELRRVNLGGGGLLVPSSGISL